jgi:hypothetical protein
MQVVIRIYDLHLNARSTILRGSRPAFERAASARPSSARSSTLHQLADDALAVRFGMSRLPMLLHATVRAEPGMTR